MSGNVQILKNFELPKAPGVHYRLVCMTGAKKGETYYLKGNRVVMGRSDTCDITIHDAKSSREHAELVRMGPSFVLTDLKSQNGVIVNDLKISQHTLVEGDRVIIGQTIYRYGKVRVEDGSADIKVTDSKEEAEEDEEKAPAEKVGKKKIMLALVGALLIYVFIGDGGDSSNQPAKVRSGKIGVSDVSADFTRGIKKAEEKKDKELERKLRSIFITGIREMREKNYYRAITEFSLALILDPGNGRAQNYLSQAKQFLDKDVQSLFIAGTRSMKALRYRAASVHYCNIMRLLQTNPEDERYKTAEKNIREIEKLLGLDDGEISCI